MPASAAIAAAMQPAAACSRRWRVAIVAATNSQGGAPTRTARRGRARGEAHAGEIGEPMPAGRGPVVAERRRRREQELGRPPRDGQPRLAGHGERGRGHEGAAGARSRQAAAPREAAREVGLHRGGIRRLRRTQAGQVRASRQVGVASDHGGEAPPMARPSPCRTTSLAAGTPRPRARRRTARHERHQHGIERGRQRPAGDQSGHDERGSGHHAACGPAGCRHRRQQRGEAREPGTRWHRPATWRPLTNSAATPRSAR